MNIYLLSILAVIIVVLLSLFVILKMTEFIKNLLQKHKLEVQTLKSNHKKEIDSLKIQHFNKSQAAIENLERNFEHKIQMLNLEKPKVVLGQRAEIMEMPICVYQSTMPRSHFQASRPEAILNQEIRYEKDKRIFDFYFEESFAGRITKQDIEQEIAKNLANYMVKHGFIDGKYKIERNTILFYFNFLQ